MKKSTPFISRRPQEVSLLTRHLRCAFAIRRALCAAAVTLALAANWPALADGFKAGDNLPDLSSVQLQGHIPDGLKGKVVLLDFWASWCEPCKHSFPVMEDLFKQYGSQGLVVIAVNVDEEAGDMDAFLKKNPATFSVVRDAGQKLVAKAQIATMPSSFLVDRDGKIRFVHTGFRGEETAKKYRQEIESLLKK